MKALTLRPEQEKALDFAFGQDAAGLFLSCGLGKSVITLRTFDELRRDGYIKRLLIVAPLSVCHIQWPSEIKKWAETAHLTCSVLHGDRDKAWEENADVCVINPHGLEWLLTKIDEPNFPDALAIDESTMFKNGMSARFDTMRKMRHKFHHRMILTGSALGERYDDLYGQIYMLDGGKALGRSLSSFRHRFFAPKYAGKRVIGWELKESAAEDIEARISHLVMRLDAEDYIHMPATLESSWSIRASKQFEKHYVELQEELFLDVRENRISAATAAVEVAKLRQLTSGWVYDDNGDVVEIQSEKVNALIDYLDEQKGQPVLIGVEYAHEIERLQERLGAEAISGKTPKAERLDIVERWNAGKIPVLLGQPTAMAHGINLQEGGCAICWYTLPWSFELYDQFNRRLNRSGQTKPVTIHHLVMEFSPGLFSIDVHVLSQLRRKCDAQTGFYERIGA